MITRMIDDLCSDDPYADDLCRITTLSREEQRALIDDIAHAQYQGFPSSTAHKVERAKQRLFEGHLTVARHMASKLCPSSKRSLVPDLIQEANIGLMDALSSYDFVQGWNFSAFATGCIRNCVLRALGKEKLIQANWNERERMRKAGTLDQFYAMQPLSLDRMIVLDDEDGTNLYSLLAAPADVPVSPPENTKQREQIEALLATLPSRSQHVLRLAYGINEEGAVFSMEQIAQRLGVSASTVRTIRRKALHCLQVQSSTDVTPFRQPETASPKPPKAARKEPQAPSLAHMRQVERLQEAYTQLLAEDQCIKSATLARRAGVHYHTASKFLRRRTAETPIQGVPHARLEQAYGQLQAEGHRITGYALACRADVHWRTAQTFLREQVEASILPTYSCTIQQQLREENDAHLQTQGAVITLRALAHVAQGNQSTVSTFLKKQEESCSPQRQSNQELRARLAAACQQLQTEGQPIGERALARAAGVSRTSARSYLHLCKEGDKDKQLSCAERLSRAYVCLQSEGKPVTIHALAVRAGAHWCTARKFLQVHPHVTSELQAAG